MVLTAPITMSTYSIFVTSIVGCALAWVLIAAWRITGAFPNEPEPDDEDDF
jgi:hypothetical protein